MTFHSQKPPPTRFKEVSQTPMSLYPQRPSAPEEEQDWIEQVGARTVRSYEFTGRLWFTLFGAFASAFAPGSAASQVSWRIAVRQVFFTGFQALPLVSAIALLVGTTISIQTHLLAAQIPGEIVGKLMFAVILRELAPMATAIIVAGRSGTAMATELGNMKVNSEIFALNSMGIDPLRILVFPRIVGSIVSVLVLTVYFGAIALVGGYIVGLVINPQALEALRSGFVAAVVPSDIILFVVKCVGLGTLVGWLCCHFGLEVRNSPTEVPQRTSQAVVMTLLCCVLFNTIATASFYGMTESVVVR